MKPENRLNVQYVDEVSSEDVVYNDASEFEELEIQRVKQAKMYAGINMLPDKMKETVLLLVGGMKNRDVAKNMNVPMGTVGSNMHKSKNKAQANIGNRKNTG